MTCLVSAGSDHPSRLSPPPLSYLPASADLVPSLLGLASIRFDSTRFFPFLRASAVISDLARCFVLLSFLCSDFRGLGFVFLLVFLLVHDLYLDRILFSFLGLRLRFIWDESAGFICMALFLVLTSFDLFDIFVIYHLSIDATVAVSHFGHVFFFFFLRAAK